MQKARTVSKALPNGELLVLGENVSLIFIANYLQFADNACNLKQAFSESTRAWFC